MGTTTQVAEWATNKAWSGRGKLSELVAELERQRASRIDFVPDERSLEWNFHPDQGMFITPGQPAMKEFITTNLYVGDEMVTGLRVGDKALQQFTDRGTDPSVPFQWFQKLVGQQPAIAVDLLNDLARVTGKKLMYRTLDGRVRAVLSDRYRILDNLDVAFTALDVAHGVGAKVLEASLSESNMRLKLTDTSVWEAVDAVRQGPSGQWFAGGLGNQEFLGRVGARSVGDLPGGPNAIHPVATISNSETGQGSYSVRIGILLGACFNVATIEDVVTRVHLGERQVEGLLSPEAIEADSRAIMLKARDSIRAAFTAEKFKAIVAKIKAAASNEIARPALVVDHMIEGGYLQQGQRDKLLEIFARDYVPTQYGLAQAISRLAQDEPDGDDAAALEDFAGQVISESKLVAVPA